MCAPDDIDSEGPSADAPETGSPIANLELAAKHANEEGDLPQALKLATEAEALKKYSDHFEAAAKADLADQGRVKRDRRAVARNFWPRFVRDRTQAQSYERSRGPAACRRPTAV